MSPSSAPTRWWALLGLGVAVGGCAKRRPPPPPPDAEAVRAVRFEGNGGAFSGQSDYNLRAVMEQGQNPTATWLIAPRKRRVFLDRDTLELDAWRIEAWYAEHGYFDAAVMGWAVERRGEGGRFLLWDPPASVRVTGQVEPGAPAVLRSLQIDAPKTVKVLVDGVKVEAPLQEGATFEVDAVHATEAMILDVLLEQSYAYARIEKEVNVCPEGEIAGDAAGDAGGDAAAEGGRAPCSPADPKRAPQPEPFVDVAFEVETGPSCKFGEVEIVFLAGKDDIREIDPALIEAEIKVVEGQRYSMSALAQTRQALFGLGVFSVVNVLPQLGDQDPTVPVRIELARARDRQLRVGAGVLIESGKQDVHVSGDLLHVNLLNRLVRVEWENQLGYTTLTQISQLDESGLEALTETSGATLDSTIDVLVPRFPARRWSSATSFTVQRAIEQGFSYWRQAVAPSLRGQLTDELSLELGYNLELVQFLDLAIDPSDFRRTPLGLDFRERYVLTFLRQVLTYDARGDKIAPTRGAYGIYELGQASRALGGDFNYLKATFDHRVYLSLRGLLGRRTRGTLAVRGAGGILQPYGAEQFATVPTNQRLRLGGANDVRGWVRWHLGPYICDTEGGGPDCVGALGVSQQSDAIIPIGGLVSAYGSVEPRIYLPNDLGLAAFLDFGMVWSDLSQVYTPDREGLPVALIPSVGGGLRYNLDFAVFRADLGVRLGDEPMFNKEPRVGFHISLSEAF